MVAHAYQKGIVSQAAVDNLFNLCRDGTLPEGKSATQVLNEAGYTYQRETIFGIDQELAIDTSTTPYTIYHGGIKYFTDSSSPSEIATQYSFRTRMKEETTNYSEWSEYTDQILTADQNTEVVSVQFYRYRTREMTTICQYDVWGEWSEWQTTPVKQDANTEVKQETFYRYAEKYFLWQKLFGLMP